MLKRVLCSMRGCAIPYLACAATRERKFPQQAEHYDRTHLFLASMENYSPSNRYIIMGRGVPAKGHR